MATMTYRYCRSMLGASLRHGDIVRPFLPAKSIRKRGRDPHQDVPREPARPRSVRSLGARPNPRPGDLFPPEIEIVCPGGGRAVMIPGLAAMRQGALEEIEDRHRHRLR